MWIIISYHARLGLVNSDHPRAPVFRFFSCFFNIALFFVGLFLHGPSVQPGVKGETGEGGKGGQADSRRSEDMVSSPGIFSRTAIPFPSHPIPSPPLTPRNSVMGDERRDGYTPSWRFVVWRRRTGSEKHTHTHTHTLGPLCSRFFMSSLWFSIRGTGGPPRDFFMFDVRTLTSKAGHGWIWMDGTRKRNGTGLDGLDSFFGLDGNSPLVEREKR